MLLCLVAKLWHALLRLTHEMHVSAFGLLFIHRIRDVEVPRVGLYQGAGWIRVRFGTFLFCEAVGAIEISRVRSEGRP